MDLGEPLGEVTRTLTILTLTFNGRRFSHGQTYQAHPISCAAAAEVQRIIQKEDLVHNASFMGKYLGSLLKEKLGHHRYVGDIRGRGLFWGVCDTHFPTYLYLLYWIF
jgi:adenosylmethionine-8-amino-7-oxononanoate aminotransferase